MKIKLSTYKMLLADMPKEPPEAGGILGGENGVVFEFYTDKGHPTEKICGYAPDVKSLNAIILDWQNKEIDFMGMFHTHFWGVESLSEGDTNYIIKIMQAMPKSIFRLYFPIIVMPEMKIVPYIAERNGDDIVISRQELQIVKEDNDE